MPLPDGKLTLEEWSSLLEEVVEVVADGNDATAAKLAPCFREILSRMQTKDEPMFCFVVKNDARGGMDIGTNIFDARFTQAERLDMIKVLTMIVAKAGMLGKE